MTKLSEFKSIVYKSTKTNTTKQLKKKEPKLVRGLDLRLKKSWEFMLHEIVSKKYFH